MPHLLHVESSPRKQRSASIEIAHAFIDVWKSKHAGATVDTLDVWNTELPEFDGEALGAKYAGIEGRERTAEEVKVWLEIEGLAERFKRADVIVFSVPMWNFGVPYRLKHLIDVVSQKDLLFTFDDRGLNGLLNGRKVVVIAARGAQLDRAEHQVSYMDTWSKMVGIDQQHAIVVEKTLYGPDIDKQGRETAKAEAVALASTI